MSAHLVDDVIVPDRVAGHLALELCNTRAGWHSPTPREYLIDVRALAAWGIDNGVAEGPLPGRVEAGPGDSAPQPAACRTAQRQALQLRELSYPILLGSRDPSSWADLATLLHDIRARATLIRDGDGPARWRVPEPAQQSLVAAAVATEALLTSAALVDVAACPGEGCGWLFVDPRQRRRWCSMAVCGNRAKARRHAERLRRD